MLVLRNLSLVGQNRIFGGSVQRKGSIKVRKESDFNFSQWTRFIHGNLYSVPKRKLEYRKKRRKKPPWWNDKVAEAKHDLNSALGGEVNQNIQVLKPIKKPLIEANVA